MRNFVKRQIDRGEDAPKKICDGPAQNIYDDTDVCRLIGRRRRILVEARTRTTMGLDWGCVGHHAGMTAEWIKRIMPTADLSKAAPLVTGDEITTLRVKAKVMNRQRMMCERVSDGKSVIACVADSTMFHVGDQFDAVEECGKYVFKAALNVEAY